MRVRGGWCLIRTQRLCHKILLSLRHVCDGILSTLAALLLLLLSNQTGISTHKFRYRSWSEHEFLPINVDSDSASSFPILFIFPPRNSGAKITFHFTSSECGRSIERAQRQMTHTRTCCRAVEAWRFGDFRALTKNTFQQPKMCSASRSDVNVFTKTKQRRSPVLRFDGIPNCHIDFWTQIWRCDLYVCCFFTLHMGSLMLMCRWWWRVFLFYSRGLIYSTSAANNKISFWMCWMWITKLLVRYLWIVMKSLINIKSHFYSFQTKGMSVNSSINKRNNNHSTKQIQPKTQNLSRLCKFFCANFHVFRLPFNLTFRFLLPYFNNNNSDGQIAESNLSKPSSSSSLARLFFLRSRRFCPSHRTLKRIIFHFFYTSKHRRRRRQNKEMWKYSEKSRVQTK